jgi:hypothetical protein
MSGPEGDAGALPSTWAVLIDRSVRAALIIGAVLVLGWAWGLEFSGLAPQDTTGARLVVGAPHAISRHRVAGPRS